MPKELTIKIAGEAGQGMQAISLALAKAFKKAGLHIFVSQDFMSRIRGGNNFSQLRISQKPVFALRKTSDILVSLDKASITLHKSGMSNSGVMVADKAKFGITDPGKDLFDAPFYDMAAKTGGSELYANSAAFGVLLGMTRLDFGYAQAALSDIFADKGPEIIRVNIEAGRAGYDFARKNFTSEIFALREGKPADTL